MEQKNLTPHILIFPLPLQGPVNCMLKLAELLCAYSNFAVTFLNTDHIHRLLLRHTDVLRRFDNYPNFNFRTVPDGLPAEHPRNGEGFMELMGSMEKVTFPMIREMLVSGCFSWESERPVTVVVPDGCYGFVGGVGREVGVPVVFYETVSPCGLWTYLCAPDMIDNGEFPFDGNDLDTPIRSVPGTESFLRHRDLPGFYRSGDLSDPFVQLIMGEAKEVPRAQGLILNTFESLESPILPHMRKHCPKIYCTGPIHALIKAKLTAAPGKTNSIWEEDRSCLSWLDLQPLKSVIFVSIGSLADMTVNQMFEIWHGLVNSGKRFLWVRRPGSVIGEYEEGHIPAELVEGTKERGYIVSWAPQEDVLAHSATGAFFTHSGWNSTLESIVEGVPMICWPYFVDQQVNSRFVEAVWKVGLDMKDSCERETVEKLVRDVMDARKDEFLQSAGYWKKMAAESLSPGGSSCNDLETLIEDLKIMSNRASH